MLTASNYNIRRAPKLFHEQIVLDDVNPGEVKRFSLLDLQGIKKPVFGYFYGKNLVIERNNLPKGIYCVFIYGRKIFSRIIVLPK